jgi:hypothetical protein
MCGRQIGFNYAVGVYTYQREQDDDILAPGAVQHDNTAVEAGRRKRRRAEQGGRHAATHERALIVVVHSQDSMLGVVLGWCTWRGRIGIGGAK